MQSRPEEQLKTVGTEAEKEGVSPQFIENVNKWVKAQPSSLQKDNALAETSEKPTLEKPVEKSTSAETFKEKEKAKEPDLVDLIIKLLIKLIESFLGLNKTGKKIGGELGQAAQGISQLAESATSEILKTQPSATSKLLTDLNQLNDLITTTTNVLNHPNDKAGLKNLEDKAKMLGLGEKRGLGKNDADAIKMLVGNILILAGSVLMQQNQLAGIALKASGESLLNQLTKPDQSKEKQESKKIEAEKTVPHVPKPKPQIGGHRQMSEPTPEPSSTPKPGK